MSSTTTNIGLYKKNPSTDGNDTFDINTMLNDNWDRIDAQIGAQVSVSPPPAAVNLVNGLQVVNVPQSSPFDNLNVKGRTLVNLLGRDGNCEDVSKWVTIQLTAALDSTNKAIGSNSFRGTLTSTQGVIESAELISRLNLTKNYLIVSDIKNGSATNGLALWNVVGSSQTQTNVITDTTKFQVAYVTLGSANLTGAISAKVRFVINGLSGQIAYVDGIRLYEIAATEKAYIDGLTTANAQAYIAAKYPYVDDIKHVSAPYLIKYGENQAPTFNEATLHANAVVSEPYKLTLSATANSQLNYIDIPAIVGQQYTFSITHNGKIALDPIDSSGGAMIGGTGWSTAQSITFTAPNLAKSIRLYFSNDTLGAGTFTFSNPMLNLGSTAKPFKPRNDDRLAFLNTQLASNLDVTVYDSLFKRDGKYFVEKRFKDMVLDGSLAWIFGEDAVGYKKVYINTVVGMYNSQTTKTAVKYDGKILTNYSGSVSTGDIVYTNGASNVVEMWIFDTDSGWGETYTPTADEIKAYFYGWAMHDSSSTSLPYITGTKRWRKVGNAAGNGTVGVDYNLSVMPTTPTTWLGSTPYKLTYQLATPTFEEIQVEESMSLHAGLNQIEVGQGVVVREKANPYIRPQLDFVLINASNFVKNRTNRILVIYKNGKEDKQWTIYSNYVGSVSAYGGASATISYANFDPTATYEVTYIALDQYLLSTSLQAINIETASNLKTVVDSVVQNQADLERSVTELFTSVSNGKTAVASAITGKGIPASGSDSFTTLSTKISSISTGSGNAVAADVLAGKTFTNGMSSGLTGTMPNRNTSQIGLNGAGSLGRMAIQVPNGYWDGNSSVYWDDPDFIAANIKSGVNIFGVVGDMTTLKSAKFSNANPVSTNYSSPPNSFFLDFTGLTFAPKFVLFYGTSVSMIANGGGGGMLGITASATTDSTNFLGGGSYFSVNGGSFTVSCTLTNVTSTGCRVTYYAQGNSGVGWGGGGTFTTVLIG
ncbi:hypothetical protein [Paenibacillus qinlingensis]|uniref:Tail fiber protein n=1 Tax=Paenibacillus qinlingensis TaxID=1837343 RepID=A0ABU1P2P3_9BACL|nr:hypothetical protein [Paenibacillus qinlingensis]MDR6553844.1 hypothetical protein [Paenibacillus qinlingensis]